MSSGVGSEVQSQCRKCGLTWHVVIAAVRGAIAQVECGGCGARHKHRPVGGSAKSGSLAAVRPRARGATSRRANKTPVVEGDPSRPRRAFSAADTYEVGDRVVHASFGEGVVQAVKGPRKVEVLFGEGPKVLVHGRGSG